MSVIVSPSLLSADFLHLSKDIEMVNRSQADWFHLDIMDGVFVPNISYGLPVVSQIKKMATKPHTPVSLLEDVIEDIDVVLLMSVNPGFGGQSFIEQTINKVDKLKKLIMESNSHTLIEIDGGVNFETGKRLVNAGADALVAGSFVFNSPDPEANIKGLKEL